jgi:DNA-directed RNA polymerase subunit beta
MKCLKSQRNASEIKEFLDKIYNGSGKKEDISGLSDAEILSLASNLIEGVPFATPVFDGATEDEIKGYAGTCGITQIRASHIV